MSRVKNLANVDVYIKVLKSNMPTFGAEYQKASLEQVAADYYDFLEELLNKTPRPTKDLLVKACRKVHPEVAQEAVSTWASKILDTICFIRAKAKSSTSMAKVSFKIKGLVRLVKKLKEHDPSTEKFGHSKSQSENSLDDCFIMSEGSKSSSSKATRAEIFAAYGLGNDLGSSKASSTPSTLAIKDREVIEIDPSQDTTAPIALQWFDASENVMKRKLADGTVCNAKMSVGRNGFLMMQFDCETPVETEIPNMMITPVLKRPAASKSKVFKRPAAKKCKKTNPPDDLEDEDGNDDVPGDDDGGDEEEDDGHLAATTAAEVKPKSFFTYSNPYAYPTGSVAIRRKGPESKKEIVSVKFHNLTVDYVKSVMSRLTKHLNDGTVAESEAKQWALDNVH